jgi:SART-1 family
VLAARGLLLRLYRAKAKRKMEADLAKVKGLGEAKPEVDDVAAWVSRSRESEAEAKRKAEREKAAKMASMYDEEVRHAAMSRSAGLAWHVQSGCAG